MRHVTRSPYLTLEMWSESNHYTLLRQCWIVLSVQIRSLGGGGGLCSIPEDKVFDSRKTKRAFKDQNVIALSREETGEKIMNPVAYRVFIMT